MTLNTVPLCLLVSIALASPAAAQSLTDAERSQVDAPAACCSACR